MQSFKKRVPFILFCLLMSLSTIACVSEQSRLMQGRASFQRQDYYQAFQQLKSLAKAGNPEAEYAVGYMYFYGRGVMEDKKLAKEYMQKAASHGNPLAIQALRLM